MAKQQKIRASSVTGAGVAAARAVGEGCGTPNRTGGLVAEMPAPNAGPDPEQIAQLAYSYWQARGCPWGSPEEDWIRAEAELGNRLGRRLR
jgi:DUF2934 family protein